MAIRINGNLSGNVSNAKNNMSGKMSVGIYGNANGYKREEVDALLQTKANVEHEHEQYLTEHQSLDHLALKEHEHEQYLTEHQTLDHLALKEHEHEQYLTEHQSLDHLALKEHEHEQYLTEHQSLDHLALKEHEHEDLQSDIDTVYSNTLVMSQHVTRLDGVDAELSSRIDDVDAELSSRIDGKADIEHTHSQYLTEHQSLDHLALKEHEHEQYVDNETYYGNLNITSGHVQNFIQEDARLNTRIDDVDAELRSRITANSNQINEINNTKADISYVNDMINSALGNLGAQLDEINGEEI